MLAVPRCNERNIQQEQPPARSRYQTQATEFTISWDRATDLRDEYASLIGHQWQVGNIFSFFPSCLCFFFFPGAFFTVILVTKRRASGMLHNCSTTELFPSCSRISCSPSFSDCLCKRPHGISFEKRSSALHSCPCYSHTEQEALGAGKTSMGISVLIPSQAKLG